MPAVSSALARACVAERESATGKRAVKRSGTGCDPGRRADVAMIAPLAVPGLGDAARALVPGAVGRAHRQGRDHRHVGPPARIVVAGEQHQPAQVEAFCNSERQKASTCAGWCCSPATTIRAGGPTWR
jgi:hypothetical protein